MMDKYSLLEICNYDIRSTYCQIDKERTLKITTFNKIKTMKGTNITKLLVVYTTDGDGKVLDELFKITNAKDIKELTKSLKTMAKKSKHIIIDHYLKNSLIP